MTARLSRSLVVLWVCFGMLNPQGAAILTALGLASGRVLVVCTGDGLRNLRIDAEGNPVELSGKVSFCALIHAADTASAAFPGAAPARIAYFIAPSPAPETTAPRPGHSPTLPRAPPRV